MEQVSQRVQHAIANMMKTLENEHIRKMQAKMYHCSATCCENQHYNADDVNRCLEKCQGPVNQSRQLLDTELNNYQDRLGRCAMDCQDQVRDKVGPNTSEADISKHRGAMEKCVIKCADTHIALVPAMLKRMQDVLKQHH